MSPSNSLTDVLQQALPIALSYQRDIDEQRRRIAMLEADLEQLRAAHGQNLEMTIALRSLLRRERDQAAGTKRSLEALALQAERRAAEAEARAEQAEHDMAAAKFRADLAEQELRWDEVERAHQEANADAIIKQIDDDANVRIREADDRARLAADESTELAGKLHEIRIKYRKRGKQLRKIGQQRDQLRDQAKVDQEYINSLRDEIHSLHYQLRNSVTPLGG